MQIHGFMLFDWFIKCDVLLLPFFIEGTGASATGRVRTKNAFYFCILFKKLLIILSKFVKINSNEDML